LADDPYPLTTADGSRTLYSPRYRQSYASSRGAVSEARLVFLEHSGVAAQLAQGEAVRVLEVGFGSGLNFFVTAHACVEPSGSELHYSALEHTLLEAETVRQLGYEAFVGDELLSAYLDWREIASELRRFAFESVTLELLLGEATQQALPVGSFHAIYHDAFSPEVNPELWSEDFLAKLVRALRPGGTLVSYCVQGAVRRRLRDQGLVVAKRPGPAGGKREVLVAHKAPVSTPWSTP
jgi:tRNA U34 5-methylaminomethyl-2-thiouridine-forming methyltransferase MnmC